MQFEIMPFVGKGYKDAGVKILVVGESHYTDEIEKFKDVEELRNITINTVEKFLDDEWSIPYFERITEFLNKFSAIDSFEDVAFINFFQKVLLRGVGLKKGTDLEDSQEQFLKKVEFLSPDVIVVFSDAAYSKLPSGKKFETAELKFGDSICDRLEDPIQIINYWEIIWGKRVIPIFNFNHLHSKKTSHKYKPLLKEFENDELKVKEKWNKIFK